MLYKSKWVLNNYIGNIYNIDGIVYTPNIAIGKSSGEKDYNSENTNIYRWKKHYTVEALTKFVRNENGLIEVWELEG